MLSFHRALPLVASLFAPGCFVITDLDAYEQEEADCNFEADEVRDLRFAFREFSPHVEQRTELSVATTGNNQLRTLAIFDPLEIADFDVRLRSAIPAGSHRVDLWSDMNGNKRFDQPSTTGGDHAWRIKPCTPVTAFVHNGSFDDLPQLSEIGADFTMTVNGPPDEVAQRPLEVHVIEEESGRTVGFYRNPSIPRETFSFTIPGIIDPSSSYRIDFYFDQNRSRRYEPPPVDAAFRRRNVPATSEGLTLGFAFEEEVTDIEL